MQLTSFTIGAAVLLALAQTTIAGTARVINNCGVPIYMASVVQGKHTPMALMSGSYSQAYSGEGVGVSIKLAPTATGPVTQFEFTLAGGKINYDMSNIDGYPFSKAGLTLSPSVSGDSKFPSCVPVDCPAGQAVCTAAYNQPDDTRTLVCNSSVDLVLTLCSHGSMKRDESSARVHARHLPKLIEA